MWPDEPPAPIIMVYALLHLRTPVVEARRASSPFDDCIGAPPLVGDRHVLTDVEAQMSSSLSDKTLRSPPPLTEQARLDEQVRTLLKCGEGAKLLLRLPCLPSVLPSPKLSWEGSK